MINIVLTCAACNRNVTVFVMSEWVFKKMPFNKMLPLGWRIRAPRTPEGARPMEAVAYCPEHANNRRMDL